MLARVFLQKFKKTKRFFTTLLFHCKKLRNDNSAGMTIVYAIHQLNFVTFKIVSNTHYNNLSNLDDPM